LGECVTKREIMEKQCKKCDEMVEGEDLGDNPCWLTFVCECGHYWGENCLDDYVEMVENRYGDK